MVGITDFFMVSAGILIFVILFFPLILKKFVNKKIEKRYNCKLDVEQEALKYFNFYWYFKYFNPGKTIAMAYLFRSQKMIENEKSLKAINYNIKTAPRSEIFICCFCWIIGFFAAICLFSFFVLVKIFDVKP